MPKGKQPRKQRKREWYDKYSEWLQGMKWTWFVTWTTPYELTLPSARRLVERTAHAWRELDHSVRVFWVAERFELKDGYHLHGLVYARKGEELFGEFCQVYQAMARGRVVGNADGKVIRSVDKKLHRERPAQSWGESGPACNEAGKILFKTLPAEDGPVKARWCRIQLSKFNPKRAAADYLVPYMFKEQSKGRGADYDWCLPSDRRDKTPRRKRK